MAVGIKAAVRSPADELQFEGSEAGHAVTIVLDADKPNPLFQTPIGQDARVSNILILESVDPSTDLDQHILDIGTAMDYGLCAYNHHSVLLFNPANAEPSDVADMSPDGEHIPSL
ncbi:hypothetical protein N7520_011978 [Penicillium odoratum]|uniref:uncharacterized protein n=1 Tax=Penicillium odoratum TaxID=1167516 RepID=UPI0025475215|nr:uncharacterized protein N7520_011978 [Penicillium odoratum]KAJ5746796.1 hypothetical protein N7520_011978 [Penicillium odoratum]